MPAIRIVQSIKDTVVDVNSVDSRSVFKWEWLKKVSYPPSLSLIRNSLDLVVRHGSLSGRRGRLSSKTRTKNSDEPPSPPLPLLSLITRSYESCVMKDPRNAGPTVSHSLLFSLQTVSPLHSIIICLALSTSSSSIMGST